MELIAKERITVKVSSVLGRDVKSYGKQYIFDNCEDTCWNSDQGLPQWIAVSFSSKIPVSQFMIQFQGGFAAKEIQLQRVPEAGSANTEVVEMFFPEDSNGVQTFSLTHGPVSTDNLRFTFLESTDMFGRIIVYQLGIFQKVI